MTTKNTIGWKTTTEETKEEKVARVKAEEAAKDEQENQAKPQDTAVKQEGKKKENKKSETKKKSPDKDKKSEGPTTTITIKDLEEEFGVKGKVIRRHLRKMEENDKPRGSARYEWKSTDPNYKKIHKKLTELFTKTG